MKLFASMIPDPHRRRVLLSIIAVIAVYGLSIGLLFPLISLNMEARGYSRTMIGLMGVMPFLSSIIASPFTPIIMRSINITRLCAICIAAEVVLLICLPLFDSIVAWFIIRFLMGVAGTGLFVASETWINEIAEDHYRGRIIGIYTFMISITFAIGPLFVLVLGVEGFLPFVVPALIIGLAFIPLWQTRDSKPNFSDSKVSQVFGFLWISPALVAAAAIVSFEEATFVTLMPVYAVRNGLSQDNAAIFLTILATGSMVAQPFVGWLADKLDRVAILNVCAAVTVIGPILLPFAIQNAVFSAAVLLVWGAGVAGIYTIAMTLMGQRFRGAQLAAGNAMFGLMWGVAGSAGPAIGGPLMDVWDPHGFIAVLLVFSILFLAFSLFRSSHEMRRY